MNYFSLLDGLQKRLVFITSASLTFTAFASVTLCKRRGQNGMTQISPIAL